MERKLAHLVRRRHGGRRVRVRGLAKVAADFNLLAAAVNLARLGVLDSPSHPGPAPVLPPPSAPCGSPRWPGERRKGGGSKDTGTRPCPGVRGKSKAGVLLDLAALRWSAEGVRVKFSAGKRTVIDGPFGEAKEIVAGYWILQVKSMEEAVEWAKRLPFEAGGEPEAEGEIELRQLFELEELGESRAVE